MVLVLDPVLQKDVIDREDTRFYFYSIKQKNIVIVDKISRTSQKNTITRLFISRYSSLLYIVDFFGD